MDKIRLEDIIPKIGTKLITQDYYSKSINEKKQMIEEELSTYMLFKIAMINPNRLDVEKDYTLSELFQMLDEELPRENGFSQVDHIIHYILALASEIQGIYIIWQSSDEDESLIDNPVVDFKENIWDSLIVHPNTNSNRIFNLVFDTFMNKFMTLPESNILEMKNSDVN